MPIAWDWWNKRAQLTVDTKSIATIASNSKPIPNLELFFNKKRIRAVNKVALEIRNTGRTPITKEDVVVPLTIFFGDGEILEAKAIRCFPENLEVNLQQTTNKLEVGFPLLNPNELIAIDVLTTTEEPLVTASARIKNIIAIDLVRTADAIAIRPDVLGSSVFSAVLGLLLTFVGFALGREIPQKYRVLKALRDRTHPILLAQNHGQARESLYEDFEFLSEDRRKKADIAIDSAQWPLTDQTKDDVRNILIDSAHNEGSVVSCVMTLAIGIAALIFSVTRFTY